MDDRKRSLRTLGSGLLIVLGLCAFGASSAQAEGEWRINGAKLTGEEELTGLVADTVEHLFLLPSLGLAVHCKVELWVGVKLLASGESRGTHRYDECRSTFSGKEQSSCNPPSIEFKFKSLLLLHNKKTYLLFEPLEGGAFGEIKFPETCAFAEAGKVSGSYVMECVEPASCETEVVVRQMVLASTALFPSDLMKMGASPLTMDGR
ncbi:MAG TPA: hypothetical protein VJQ84_10205, partial [Solirubrobacterales bacterium]|nr:hypothetical protein [Solirubrobacterales bacterium]